MAKTSSLEARLESLTRDYLAAIIATLRNASFTDVAGLAAPGARGPRPGRVTASPSPAAPQHEPRSGRGAAREREKALPRERQTADKRAELRDRVLDVLRQSSAPLGVRALSGELSVAADRLAAPLRELRASGHIAKHGEKRATTYSAA